MCVQSVVEKRAKVSVFWPFYRTNKHESPASALQGFTDVVLKCSGPSVASSPAGLTCEAAPGVSGGFLVQTDMTTVCDD